MPDSQHKQSSRTDPTKTQAANSPPKIEEAEGDGWTVSDGRVSTTGNPSQFTADGIEPLSFNNPFRQGVERVWFDGRLIFALDAGEVDIATAGDVKVAKEYQPIYSVELDDQGKLKKKEEVGGQYNIYDSVPGMKEYSPIWQFYYVVVPRDYQPNSLRSAQDCENSGYPIHKSNMFEN